MTDPTASGAPTASGNPAPGWYPDGSGSQRWWNGVGWTEHTAAAAAPAQPLQRPALPAGTAVDNAWVWVVSLSYLLSMLSLVFFDMRGYMRSIMSAGMGGDPTAVNGVMTNYILFFGLTWLLGLAVWGFTVFAAYRDYKHLEAVGVVRPFHWGFAFIPYTIVYLIGRHVVLRKVSRTAGWPLWAHIGSYALVFIITIVWTLVMMQGMFSDMSYYLGPSLYS